MGRITVDARPVFSEGGAFYRAVNRLHAQTRASFIRRFLLFHEGDRFDPVLLEETARNLRSLDSLESVSVTAGESHDGVVDITVVTTDAWTTDLTGDFSNEGGKSVFNVDGSQKNLFGGAESLALLFDRDVYRTTRAIEYRDPAAFGPYWNLDAYVADNSDGAEQRFTVIRPQFSYATTWTGSMSANHLRRVERIYRDGVVLSAFEQRHRSLMLSGGWAMRSEVHRTDRVVAGLDFTDDEFMDGPLLPDARHLHFVDVGFESTGFSQKSLDYIDDSRVQDFNLGHVLSLHGAVSSNTWRARVVIGDGVMLGEHAFVRGELTGSKRGDGNEILSADVRAVSRLATQHPQSMVARLRADFGWKLDRDVQFFADGPDGLRAYPDFAFEGSRRLLVNAEYRAYLGRDLLQIFSPGVAAFADAGYAGEGSLHMKSDFGVGVRIGIPHYDGALIRIDYAYAPQRHRGVLSIATMQAF